MERESFCELGRRMYRLRYWPELHRYIVFAARSVLYRKPLLAMQDRFRADPLLAELARLYPYVYEQATRAFFYKGSTLQERIALIERHMAFMAARFADDTCRALYSPRLLQVPVWAQGEGGPFSLALFNGPGQRKEGLLSLVLRCNGRWLYQLMMWLDDSALHIGAMQGPGGDDAREFVRAATKSAHGLRPKNFIVVAAQAMARHLGLPRIVAVTSAGYYANNHVRVDRKLKTDFTEFWHELGGHDVEGDGRFCDLPLSEPRKPIDEVPARKRAVYRRRFAMLDDLERGLPVGLASLERGGAGLPDGLRSALPEEG